MTCHAEPLVGSLQGTACTTMSGVLRGSSQNQITFPEIIQCEQSHRTRGTARRPGLSARCSRRDWGSLAHAGEGPDRAHRTMPAGPGAPHRRPGAPVLRGAVAQGHEGVSFGLAFGCSHAWMPPHLLQLRHRRLPPCRVRDCRTVGGHHMHLSMEHAPETCPRNCS